MVSATQEQVMALLDFLEDHPQLAKGNLRHLEARQESKRLWESITQVLNGLGGASKTATQWQKVWADKKFVAKGKAAERARGAHGTGGGPAVGGKLTEVDLRVLQIMGEGFGGPQTGAVVNPFESKSGGASRAHPAHISRSPSPATRQPVSVAPPREDAVRQRPTVPATPPRQTTPQLTPDEHSYAFPTPEEARVRDVGDGGAVGSQEHCPPGRSERNTRRRRLVQNNSVERLVASEEEKLSEFKKIRTALDNMTVVLNAVNTSLSNLVDVFTKK